MIIKLIGLGFKGYLHDKYNIFDASIVLISMIEIILNATSSGSNNSTISKLRSFRILRLLKLVKSFRALSELLSTIANTLKDLRNFMVLLFICIFCYTMLGLELYGYRMKFDKENKFDLENGTSPRINFDGFGNGFTTVFNVL